MNWLQKTNAHMDDEYFYHITTTDNAYDISSEGLTPHPPEYGNDVNWAEQYNWPDGGIEDRSYFGESEKDVEYFGKDFKPVIIRARRELLEQYGLGSESVDWFITKVLPPEHIEIKVNGTWMPLAQWFEAPLP